MRPVPVVGLVAACTLEVWAGCATLQELGVLQPPRFATVQERPAELRLLAPSTARPLGGAAIRLWARVENPNPVGLTLAEIAGNLLVEGTQAAEVAFPLGLPLLAGRDTVIPLEVALDFSRLPALAGVLRRAVAGEALDYRLDGTVAVDAGAFGRPRFGPMTLLAGELAVFR